MPGRSKTLRELIGQDALSFRVRMEDALSAAFPGTRFKVKDFFGDFGSDVFDARVRIDMRDRVDDIEWCREEYGVDLSESKDGYVFEYFDEKSKKPFVFKKGSGLVKTTREFVTEHFSVGVPKK